MSHPHTLCIGASKFKKHSFYGERETAITDCNTTQNADSLLKYKQVVANRRNTNNNLNLNSESNRVAIILKQSCSNKAVTDIWQLQ